MIDKLACLSLEKAINTALAMDSDSQQRLTQLAGKVIQLSITDWNIEIYARYDQHGIQLFTDQPSHVDTTIKGRLFGLIRVGLAKGEGAALFEQKIEIDGNTTVGEHARELFSKLDIDWEDHLSRLVGDNLAYHIGKGAKATLNALKTMRQASRQSTTEYLQYEIQALPSQQEVQHLFQGIQTCRDDVERVSARIALLQKGHTQ